MMKLKKIRSRISKILEIFKHLSNLISYLSVPAEKRNVVFYSEGRDYWSYLSGLIKCLIEDYNVRVCYLSSNFDDPGITYDKKILMHS